MTYVFRSSVLLAGFMSGTALLVTPAAFAQTAAPSAPAAANADPMPDAPVVEPAFSTVATVAETPDSGTMKRADKDMATVLRKLGELGAKPIQSRSVEQARSPVSYTHLTLPTKA